MLRGRVKHQGTFKYGREEREKKKKGKGSLFFSSAPKDLCKRVPNRCQWRQGSSWLLRGGTGNIPIPELSAYVGSWFPRHAGLRAALEQHQRPESQGPADRSLRNARGKQNKNKPQAPPARSHPRKGSK